jgi:hypothetical protein
MKDLFVYERQVSWLAKIPHTTVILGIISFGAQSRITGT